jgi:succinate dehydrogenase hydrophobic anchor subunit
LKREIPLVLTAIIGLTFFIQFFVPHAPMGFLSNMFTDWFSIIAAAAIWLGALNLMRVCLEKIYKKDKDWFFSAVTIASFLLIVIIGFFFSGGRSFQDPGTRFDWLYINIYTPLMATMFALLAFFVASASYRAFRARNAQATVLLLAAFVVMLGRTPFGDWLSKPLPDGWGIANLSNIVMNYFNVAGQRAIMIGIALGTVSTSLRIILGIERSYLGGE